MLITNFKSDLSEGIITSITYTDCQSPNQECNWIHTKCWNI